MSVSALGENFVALLSKLRMFESLSFSGGTQKHFIIPLIKAVPLHAMDALGGERRYSSSVTTSVVDGVSGQCHSSATLNPQYPLDRRLVGLQSKSGQRG
jgi:hypothetical protein